MKILKVKQNRFQHGQTLIETLVGAFILVMGISAAVGLAVYVFGASSNISKQIIATGLARQGIEIVKNMRDTNWLKAPLTSNCYNFETGNMDAYCYQDWIGLKNGQGQWGDRGQGAQSYDRGYNFDPGSSPASYSIPTIDTDATDKTWVWNAADKNPTTNNFGIDFDNDVSSSAFAGFYISSNRTTGASGYYQQIIMSDDTSIPPYNNSSVNTTLGPLFKVQSRVWWDDKHCASSATFDGASPGCRVELIGYLTNWKDYQ